MNKKLLLADDTIELVGCTEPACVPLTCEL